MNHLNIDYRRIITKCNDRATQTDEPKCKITEIELKQYEKDKAKLIKLRYDNEIYNPFDNFDFHSWDISFASQYRFPCNRLSFDKQWFMKKLEMFVPYLCNIKYTENSHICYKLIGETTAQTLDELCDKIDKYNGRRCSGNGEDLNEEQYKKQCTRWGYDEQSAKQSYLNTVEQYNKYEQNPIHLIIPCYNELAFNGTNNKMIEYIVDKNGIENMQNDLLNYKLDTNNEKLWHILKRLTTLITSGYPFWTLYLPEKIKQFEEVRILSHDGNFTFIVARSEKYFYFMQRSD